MNVDPVKTARAKVMSDAKASLRKFQNFIDHLEDELRSFDEPTVKMAVIALKAVEEFMTHPDGISRSIDQLLEQIDTMTREHHKQKSIN